MPSQYIRECAHACASTGYCQLTEYEHILRMAQDLVNQAKGNTMSNALWCDEGEHAFSSRDMNRREITMSGFDKDGNRIQLTQLACSKHIPHMRGEVMAIEPENGDDDF